MKKKKRKHKNEPTISSSFDIYVECTMKIDEVAPVKQFSRKFIVAFIDLIQSDITVYLCQIFMVLYAMQFEHWLRQKDDPIYSRYTQTIMRIVHISMSHFIYICMHIKCLDVDYISCFFMIRLSHELMYIYIYLDVTEMGNSQFSMKFSS